MSKEAQTIPAGLSQADIDIWKAEFAQNCLYIFGAPTSIKNCLDKEERYYFSYCTICLSIAMKEHEAVWKSYLEYELDVEDAAYAFAEFYESEHNDTLIPMYKGAGLGLDDLPGGKL